ncbi:restriction endonuclease subunit R [Maribellus luteus]|uniref:Restriction endonuclease subunit R n=1 Tax=Maribellus luteus TaxID=2305463 RepID=A0A399SRE5_9BACT|nr:DEAD/DEAH box helicase family protein [Maribellus luteus]RIJ45494.1 restriction endonuclease subunit R [Maribellus luteus]
MNLLFKEQKTKIKFKSTWEGFHSKNRILFHIGEEEGILRKYEGRGFKGYEFDSDCDRKYFISTQKSKVPDNYDAVFFVNFQDQSRSSLDVLRECEKKLLKINLPSTEVVNNSWYDAFSYKKEEQSTKEEKIKGLRPPQIGALHAIQAHWSISKNAAIVVMPTGTGKTETMLCLTVAEQLNKILIIVPSDSLRTQIAGKFCELGILKNSEFNIVSKYAINPLVGILTSSFKNLEQVQEFYEKCNVLIATNSILAECKKNDIRIFNHIINASNYLIVDEAHHCEATTWDNIALAFVQQKKPVLKFTATPFRNDKRRLKGTIIYNYPLSLAQRDGSFKEINFVPVIEFNEKKVHELIAQRAVNQLKKDIDEGYDHVLMARVDDINKAEEIFEIYKKYAEFNPVLIHSRTERKKELLERIKSPEYNIRIIVCVNMLGEGFDLPELKICALHVIHKNITTSIQFFGRFTRSSSKKVGTATIIANIGDSKLKDNLLKKLYAKDADWNRILRTSNEGIAENLNKEESFFQKFVEDEIPYKIPLRNITPALSTVVYKVNSSNPLWRPEKHKDFFEKRKTQSVFAVHEEKNLIVIISRSQTTVKWGVIDDLINNVYELFIVYYNPIQKLLFINSSNNGSLYEELAKKIIGDQINLINESDIYKSLHEVEQLELFNLGVKPISEESISYTQLFGRNVGEALDDITKETKASANLFGKGFSNGERMTIGCSSKGRVWSRMIKTIPEFCEWCDGIGGKLVNPDINVQDIFQFIAKPVRVPPYPKECKPISIMWNDELYFRETDFFINGHSFHNFKISLDIEKSREGQLYFSISDSSLLSSVYSLVLSENKNSRGYSYLKISGNDLMFSFGRNENISIQEFFNEFPPIIRFADSSKMYNDIFFEFKYDIQAFNPARIETMDWKAMGVDITKESQFDKRKEYVREDSIQYQMIQELEKDNDYKIIFDDDDKDEVSDIIGIKYFENDYSKVVFDLYHCKFSKKDTPGARLDDLYTVCGQAQRSFHWKHRVENLIHHIQERENQRIIKNKPSRFCKGGNVELFIIKKMVESGMCNVICNIQIVQPGVSKSRITSEQLKLLGATDMLLKNTGNNFNVIISE